MAVVVKLSHLRKLLEGGGAKVPQDIEESEQFVPGVLDERLISEEFIEDDPHWPDIHLSAVVSSSKNNLGGSVIEGLYFVRVQTLSRRANCPRQAHVCQSHSPGFWVVKNILRLDVPV